MEPFRRLLKLDKFRGKHDPKGETEARKELKHDLFAYSKNIEHGFPYKPSAIAYDNKLGLLAIGTRSGALRIYGQPGVQLSSEHGDEETVTRLCFIPEEAKLVTLCGNKSLHLWEIITPHTDAPSTLTETHTFSLDNSKLQTVSAWCLMSDSRRLLLGTEAGELGFFDTAAFALTETILRQDDITKNMSDEFRVSAGAIESILQSPSKPDTILIGFARGIIVLWDLSQRKSLNVYNSMQQLESLSFIGDGREFVSIHSDGSYIIWATVEAVKPKEDATTPYGPFPCRAINKLDWLTGDSGEPFLIFTGGMPRANYGDRYTLSLMHVTNHAVLEFTSKIIDYIVICGPSDFVPHSDGEPRTDVPDSLIILAEEELVVIDLSTDDWPVYHPPYLSSLHSTPITCVTYSNNLPDSLWNKIVQAGSKQLQFSSSRPWPISGGRVLCQSVTGHDLILTGHEDGSVRFWDVSNGGISLLYRLDTGRLFGVDVLAHSDSNSEVEWPPFRKVGTYDPFTDDPRLAIQTIAFCTLSESLLVTGNSGQVILHQFEREPHEQDVKFAVLNVRGTDTSVDNVWRGHAPLEIRCDDVTFPAGFQPTSVIQLQPPVKCTAVSFQSEWQLLAVATEFGFGLFDIASMKIICVRSAATPHGAAVDGIPLSRRKSFQKSVRQSFRKVPLFRSVSTMVSQRRRRTNRRSATEIRTETDEHKSAATSSEPIPSTSRMSDPVPRRDPEASPSTSAVMSSIVHCVYFADSFLINGTTHGPIMLAGTALGHVCAYRLTLPANDKRDSEPVQCTLAKVVRLKHGSPVINLCIIDRTGWVLPAPLETQHQRAKQADMSGGHQLIVCSQEQLKMFTLPGLKAQNKFKISSKADPIRITHVAFTNFCSSIDETYTENDLICLTNGGQATVFNIPQLHVQLQAAVGMQREDTTSGALSNPVSTMCMFTRSGLGFIQSSLSEFREFSLSARLTARFRCTVDAGRRTADIEVVVERSRPDFTDPEVRLPIVGEADNANRTNDVSSRGAQQTSSRDQSADHHQPIGSIQQSGDGSTVIHYQSSSMDTSVTVSHSATLTNGDFSSAVEVGDGLQRGHQREDSGRIGRSQLAANGEMTPSVPVVAHISTKTSGGGDSANVRVQLHHSTYVAGVRAASGETVAKHVNDNAEVVAVLATQ